MLAHDPADPAAEGQPCDAGVGDDAGRHREPERLRLPVELAEQHACLGARDPALGIDSDALHRGEVDHQRVVRDRVAGERVAAAADRNGNTARAGGLDGRDHVGDPGAAGDRGRTPVDRAVPDPPVLVETRIGGTDDLAAECSVVQLERVDGRAHAVSLARSGARLKADSRRCRATCRRRATRTPAAARSRRLVELLGVVGLKPDVLARDRRDQSRASARRSPDAGARGRPDVDEVGVADAVGAAAYRRPGRRRGRVLSTPAARVRTSRSRGCQAVRSLLRRTASGDATSPHGAANGRVFGIDTVQVDPHGRSRQWLTNPTQSS